MLGLPRARGAQTVVAIAWATSRVRTLPRMSTLPIAAAVRRAVFAILAMTMVLLAVAQAPSGADQAPGTADDDTAVDGPAVDPDALREVDILPLEGFVDPPVAGAIVDLIADANERDAEVVVIQLDAEGAISADLDELVEAVRASAVPVVVFVGPRSAQARGGGAAAALLLAAHVSAVAPDATVGPAGPLDLSDRVGDEARAEAASYLAPLAHDVLEGLTVTGQLDGAGESVTLVGEDALAAFEVDALTLSEAGVVDLVVPGLEPLLTELDGRTVQTSAGSVTIRLRSEEISVRLHSLGLARRILHAATTPTLIYLLLVVGLGMLLFEWFQPGFGVAGFTAIILVLLALFGLSVLPITWWALALVVLGLGLFAVDTAMAGFGVVTVLAAATFAVGSLNLYDSEALSLSGGIVALMTATALGFFVVVLTIILRAQAGPEDLAIEELVERPGIVRSVLNPEGHVYVDGALWRARWVGEAKRAKVGTPVRVTGTEGPTLLVEEFVARAGEATPDAREILTGVDEA